MHGLKRRSSQFNTGRIDHLYKDPHEENVRFFLHYGDLTDSSNLIRLVQEIEPDEIYNLAAQSHVQVSFDTPEYTADVDALGTLRLLEAIRTLDRTEETRFYQASTSELYGKVQEVPQNEDTPFYPRSPYAAAKLYAYWITANYREAYGVHASNGILFNRESPRRGETFVMRKITRAASSMGARACARPSTRSSASEPRSNAASGTSEETSSVTSRRPTRQPGDPGCSGPTRSRPTRPPRSSSPICTPNCSRSIGGQRVPSKKAWRRP